MRRIGALVVVAAGAGLLLAPVWFQMFSRAPLGGRMIDEFRPFMTPATIGGFREHLATIGAAEKEIRSELKPALADAGIGEPRYREELPQISALQDSWGQISEEMLGMLATMEANLDNFAAVDALPPFALFPWFFVAPGALAGGLGIFLLRRGRRGERAARWLVAIGVLGAGLIAAPSIFQMWHRAPLGAQMIEDFRPLMTEENVAKVQGYFLVIGGGEGEIRNRLPAVVESAGAGDPVGYPNTEALTQEWPVIAAEMAPMVGAMSDNLDNYAAVDALPVFDLFPWFFVIPGAVLLGTALLLAPRRAVIAAARVAPSKEG